MALENLEAATRIEAILNGDDITPATRREYFLQRAANEVPKPGGNSDAGKIPVVNSDGNGYSLEDIPEELPAIASGDAGKVLTVNAGETGVEWAEAGGGLPEIPVNYGNALMKANYAGTAAEWVRQPVVYSRMIKLELIESGGSWDITPTSDISGTLPIDDAFNHLGYGEPVYFVIHMTDSQNVETTLYSDIAEISGTDPYSGGHVLITALAPAASTAIPVYIFNWTYDDMDGVDEISVTKKSITLGT